MEKKNFKLVSDYKPMGDQINAIEKLVENLNSDKKWNTLLGVTGSGKTFTVANVIALLNKPTLIITHNKTLAAQLYGEFKYLFPNNAVEYFVSYYDFYQPEAYIPGKDLYIEKSTLINEEIEKMRLKATVSLFERNDVIIIASVSSIYGLGDPRAYFDMIVLLEKGKTLKIDDLSKHLVKISYENSIGYEGGTFKVNGDVVEVFPPYSDLALRIEYFGDEIENISEIDFLTKKVIKKHDKFVIYPAKNFAIAEDTVFKALESIKEELKERLNYFDEEKKVLEFARLKERTLYDIEMIEQTGSCKGVENYSRHFTGVKTGFPPPTLLDYFPKDFLLIIDESHVMIPQLKGMYNGDRARKSVLVEFGFRLPSALDNRPLKFDEFQGKMENVIFVSATPSEYETMTSNYIVQQIIRPTGLVDPTTEVRKTEGQVDDLYAEILNVIDKKERVLVTTLTKKMAEDLTQYYKELGIKVKYLHSDIDTIERIKILNELEEGIIDVIIGINLLREGLDLPTVSLVAILDADKQGFLRSNSSLIQTFGRCARNVNGRVIMYGDKITDAMEYAIKETDRRRKIQKEYNEKHNITPVSIIKTKKDIFNNDKSDDKTEKKVITIEDLHKEIKDKEKLMKKYAADLNFEEAMKIREQIKTLREKLITAE